MTTAPRSRTTLRSLLIPLAALASTAFTVTEAGAVSARVKVVFALHAHRADAYTQKGIT